MANQKYEAFLHIAETGSFKQAAHDLGYTQAAQLPYQLHGARAGHRCSCAITAARTLPAKAPSCCPGSATSATTSVSWLDALPS